MIFFHLQCSVPLKPVQVVVNFFSYKLVSTSKVQSPETGADSVKQKDLWFESSAAVNDGEDQVLTEISTSQHNSSLLRRGRGESMLTLCVDVVYSPKLLNGSHK